MYSPGRWEMRPRNERRPNSESRPPRETPQLEAPAQGAHRPG
jgi:hypothetical protein